MVALLWAEGNHEGAIELEQLWSDLSKRYRFALFCAYPMNGFANGDQTSEFEGVCSCHTRVIPAESYAGIEREDERLRAISLLQQQAQSLQAENEHRREVEKAFIRRERELLDLFENNHVPSAVPAAPAKRRVLVVDDNHDAGDSMAILLRVKGHEVRTARDGLEAIDVAASFRPDVILMDVGMPKLNGYDATRRIRETPHGRDIFIVALTGWGQTSDIARAKEAGCSAHLVKPADFAALDELLASAADSRVSR
jgi:CheY-like chemotaxis protein